MFIPVMIISRRMNKLLNILVLLILAALPALSQVLQADRIDAYGKLKSGAFNDAVSAFSSFKSGNGFSPGDQLSMGIAQFYSGDNTAASYNFRKLVENGFDEANIWLARIYALNKNIDETLFYIERYLKLSGNPQVESIQKDTIFKFLHISDKWFDLWQTDWYRPHQQIIQEAQFYSDRKKYATAHKIIEANITDDIAGSELFLWNGKLYLIEGNATLALNEFNQAINLNPANTQLLKERANCFLQLDDYTSALNDLNKALNIEPADFDVRYLRARAAYIAEEYEMASTDISLYLKYIGSEEAIFLAGQISHASGDSYNALINYNRLLKEFKPKAEYYKARGLTYYETGTYGPSSYDLSMSLDLDPNNAETNLYMGLAEYSKGNSKHACYYLERAKKLGSLEAHEYLQKYCKE